MNEKPEWVDATEFQRNIGAYTDQVHAGATVVVTAHKRPRMVLISPKEYDALCEARRELAWMRLAKLNEEPATGGT